MPAGSHTSHPPNRQKILQYAVYLGLFWYVLLAAVNYGNQRPLWVDEEAVFSSIQSLSAHQIFHGPLRGDQVFPRLYLYLIQTFSRLFDFHVLSLRLPSFVCMMAAFGIWMRVAGSELKNRVDYLAFVLSWTASAMLIYYASELKPYSMDVLAGAIFVWFIYHAKADEERLSQSGPRAGHVFLLILLPFLGLLSYPAFLFAVMVLYNLLISRRAWPLVRIYAPAFLTAAGLAYYFDIRHNAQEVYTGQVLKDYFLSLDSVDAFFQTFGEGVTNLFSRWLVEQPRIIKKIGIFFMTFGLLNLCGGFWTRFRKERYGARSVNTVAFFLFAALVLLGALKKYPFIVPRTVLFFCPFVLVLTIQGITALRKIHPYVYRTVYTLYFIFLIALSVGLTRLVFMRHSVFQPVVGEIAGG